MKRGIYFSGGAPLERRACPMVLAGIVCLMVGCGNAPEAKGNPGASPGAIATVDAAKMGENIKAARGTVVVVNLWATWCPPCVAEMPELARFYNETRRSEVTFISVNANAPETIAGEVKPFVEKNKLPFPVCVLSKVDPEALGKATGAEISGAIPLTLVYDRAGKLQKTLEESVTFDSLMALVKPLL